ncbi:hypothetical protein [Paracoccus denitrificans]|uniref:hypothetical protein n=1 Tax=Paracoccus denitrificans TaxID=266 RepID=UPI0033652DCC
MIVVIQCAGSKISNAGSLSTPDGRSVRFVAHPELAPDDGEFYARPDDEADKGRSWRDLLLDINRGSAAAPPNLLTAGDLYRPAAYRGLLEYVGREKLYILSAGWGLIRSDFLLPEYDITFSGQADAYKRRRKADRYRDSSMLPPNSVEPLLFFGSKDYLPLFRELSADHRGQRIVLFRSAEPPDCPDCVAVRFETSRRTNWHYEAVESYIAGNLQLPVR